MVCDHCVLLFSFQKYAAQIFNNKIQLLTTRFQFMHKFSQFPLEFLMHTLLDVPLVVELHLMRLEKHHTRFIHIFQLQEGRPVAYASRTSTETEKIYTKIERVVSNCILLLEI